MVAEHRGQSLMSESLACNADRECGCPVCEGTTARGDATRDLSWGMAVANAQPGLTRFWKIHTGAEVYRRGDHATDAEIDSLVSEVQRVALRHSELGGGFDVGHMSGVSGHKLAFDPTQPGPGRKPGEERADPGEPRRDPELGGVPMEVPSRKRRGPGLPPNARCCVEKFVYPDAVSRGKATDEGWNVQVTFWWLAKFINEGGERNGADDDRGGEEGDQKDGAEGREGEDAEEYLTICRCECCEFRQYLVYGLFDVRPGVHDSHIAHADCMWLITDESGDVVRRAWSGPDDPPTKGKGEARVWGPYCFGVKHSETPEYPPAYEERPLQGFEDCELFGADFPGMEVENERAFTFSTIFLGVIHDACNDWVWRRAKTLSFFWSGYIRDSQIINEVWNSSYEGS